MRRARRRNNDDEADVDMTPMLDIVFIMLIFFIVTAVFLDETGLDMTQPPPSDEPPPQDSNPAITVYVDENNQCSVDAVRSTCNGVMARIERQLADKPGASIILRFHPDAKNSVLVLLKDGVDGRGMSSKIEVLETAA